MNELENLQLQVPNFKRDHQIDRDLFNWMKKRISSTVQEIIGLESRRLGPDEYRRKQLLNFVNLYLVEIGNDQELSRELIHRIRDITHKMA